MSLKGLPKNVPRISTDGENLGTIPFLTDGNDTLQIE